MTRLLLIAAILAALPLSGCGRAESPPPNAIAATPTPAPAPIAEPEPLPPIAPESPPTKATLETALANIELHAKTAWSKAMDAIPTAPDIHPGISLFDTSGSDPFWRLPADAERLPPRLVILVHGLDEPGGIWDNAAPAIADAGYTVARFDYPNDQPIADSGRLLFDALADLKSRGVDRVDLICHSMGGLVARETLTAPDQYNGLTLAAPTHPRVERLITIGTPHHGSPWARLRAVGELREQAVRWFNGSNHTADDLLRFAADGKGQAGRDLLPDSDFLTALNARPNPAAVDITCIVGLAAPVKDANLDAVFDSPCLAELLGTTDADRMRGAIENLRAQIGDGVVTAQSATLEGTESITLKAHHRSLLRRNGSTPPPAIEVILQKLEQDPPETYLAP